MPSGSDVLAGHPRVALGHWPTPFEPCRRLQAEVGGPLVWLKRDDCSGLATGGNKTRKLEFLLGQALDEGHRRVVTFGAVQSNHARQTAAACARLGLECHLVLLASVPRTDAAYLGSGNVLLDGLLGATVHLVADADEAAAVTARLAPAEVVPIGGSSPVGALGYVAGALELAAQVDEVLAAPPSALVHATSSGGTAAGLAVGTALAGWSVSHHAVAVYAPAEAARAEIDPLVGSTADLVGVDVAGRTPIRITDDTLGPGYGMVTDEVVEAVTTLARCEGVLLDPVYTGKAFARLLADLRADPGADGDVVFVHTGGQAALFAYAVDLDPGGPEPLGGT